MALLCLAAVLFVAVAASEDEELCPIRIDAASGVTGANFCGAPPDDLPILASSIVVAHKQTPAEIAERAHRIMSSVPGLQVKNPRRRFVDFRRPFHRFPNRIFLETGTYDGEGIESALSAGFEVVISFEVAEHLAKKAQQKFASNPNVVVIWDTGANMMEYIRNISEPITFWLDGHYSHLDTAFLDTTCPLMLELDQISKHHIKTHSILIDDVRLLGTKEMAGITLQMLTQRITKINPNYLFTRQAGLVENDVLAAFIEGNMAK